MNVLLYYPTVRAAPKISKIISVRAERARISDFFSFVIFKSNPGGFSSLSKSKIVRIFSKFSRMTSARFQNGRISGFILRIGSTDYTTRFSTLSVLLLD